MESVFKAKKYELPLLALHPVVAGGFAVAYMTSGRFDPCEARIGLDAGRRSGRAVDRRRSASAYEKGLAEVTKARTEEKPAREEASWHHLLSGAKLELDGQGRPILQVRSGEGSVAVGITRENVLASDAPPEIVQELLVARLREQLKNGRAPKTSEARAAPGLEAAEDCVRDGRGQRCGAQSHHRTEIPGGMID